MKGWLLWIGTILTFGGIGIVIGHLLDVIVWYISYDYVYASKHFLKLGTHFGFSTGAIIAFVGTFLDSNSVNVKQWRVSVLRILFCSLMGSLLLSFCLGGLAKTGLLLSQHETIIPLPRLYFCEGVWNGALLGSTIGVLIHLWFLVKSKQVDASLTRRNQINFSTEIKT